MSMSAPVRPPDCDPKARFRSAQRRPDFTIDQNWFAYSPAEHNRWDRLFKRSHAVLRNRACDEFLGMMEKLELSQSGIPDMEKLSSRHGRAGCWIKVKNPAAPAVTREAEEDWNSVPRRFPPATPTVTRPPRST
jgi:phenylalanine-4-hydroxylase